MMMRSVLPTFALAAGLLTTTAGNPAQAQQAEIRCNGCWAFINANGTIARTRNAVGVVRPLNVGIYEVRFRYPILGCLWQGTIARGTFSSAVPDGTLTVSGLLGTDNGLYVVTLNPAGGVARRPFAVHVLC